MIKKYLNNPYLNLIVRLIVGFMFIFAAIAKIGDPALFAKEINNYNLVPQIIANLMAITLPWVELACGIFLLSGIRQKANSLVSITLYTVFTIAILLAMLQGLSINCGCHTKILADKVGWNKVLQNLGFLVLSIYIWFFPVRKYSLETLINKDRE